MFGPLFQRELVIAPKRTKIYFARTVYALLFLGVAATAWLLISGSQQIRDIGDLARFGSRLFGLLAPLQQTLILFMSAIFCAGSVCQEKDRKTLELLLLTHLSNFELTVGKLAASLVHVVSLPLASLPILASCLIFGGVDLEQVLRVFAVTLVTAFTAGTFGTVIAFRCEKTFLTLSLTLLTLVGWILLGESARFGYSIPGLDGFLTGLGLSSPLAASAAISPWQAILSAANPLCSVSLVPYYIVCIAVSVLAMAPTVLLVRVWNPPRKIKINAAVPVDSSAPVDIHAENQKFRPVWDNPILWRETRTAAYGRRLFLYLMGYRLLGCLCLYGLVEAIGGETLSAQLALWLPLCLLSLILINTQSVTAITSERDGKTLDLILSSDLRPSEFVWGKLLGSVWNTIDMFAFPTFAVGCMSYFGSLSFEFAFYLIVGYWVLAIFCATLGIHTGMIYANSRQAIGTSLGTAFFLFVGVAVCLRMMLTFSGSFQAQFQPFLALIVGGGAALYLALGARNPSPAIALASFGCPCATFYALVALLMNYSLGVFLVVSVTYGFAMAAMLIPAIYEFDIVSSKGD